MNTDHSSFFATLSTSQWFASGGVRGGEWGSGIAKGNNFFIASKFPGAGILSQV